MPAILVLLSFIALLAAPPARAGAWLQEPGAGFLSVTSTLRSDGPEGMLENAIYGEFGIGPRLTFGIDIHQRPGLSGHTLAFLRVPLGPAEGRSRLALQAGFGGYHLWGRWDGMARFTLSFGHGFRLGRSPGWLALDAGLEYRRGLPGPALKLDATAGLSGPGALRPILQVETYRLAGQDLIWTLRPGVTIDGPWGLTWIVGLEHKSTLPGTLGLKLGFWRRF